MLNTPGGKISSRPLFFNWICDCSGSMSIDGKMDALNQAIRDTLPALQAIAGENPYASVYMQAMKFSHGAQWINNDVIPISDFIWKNLLADPLESPNMDVVFLIDTSGSMGDEIEGVKQSCSQFADQIIKENINVKIGLIGFDIGGHRGANSHEKPYLIKNLSQYTIGIWNITSPKIFKQNVSILSVGLFGGAGCYLADADTVDIFPEVVNLFESGTKDAERVLVIISDEIGSKDGLNSILNFLHSGKIKTYVLGVSGVKTAHQDIAKKTEGKFWDIVKNRGLVDFVELFTEMADTIAKETKKSLGDGLVSSGTDMGMAVRLLSKTLTMPPMPERALPPVNVLISDGKPTDDFSLAMDELLSLPWGKKSIRMSIGIGKDADVQTLKKFNSKENPDPFIVYNPKDLIKIIRWVSTVALRTSSKPMIIGANQLSYIEKPNILRDQHGDWKSL